MRATSRMRPFTALAVLLLQSLSAACQSPGEKISMVWVEGWADDGNATLNSLVQRRDSINAVSLLGVVLLGPNATFTVNNTLIEQQKYYQEAGFKVFVFLATEDSNISAIRKVFSQPNELADGLLKLAFDNGFDGYNVDFEPITDVENPANNPTIDDAQLLATFLVALSQRMRSIGRSVSVDIMTIAGACRSSGHWPKDLGPCPWIRRFWQMDMLSESAGVDRIISMDTYSLNNTEFSVAVWYPLQYVPPERFAVGLCPQFWQEAQQMPTKEDLDLRFNDIKARGVRELDFWVWRLEPELLKYWEPFWPYLRDWLASP